jgi:hypothetical protein
MVRDFSAERRCALDESPAALAARDERNRQFFASTGAPDVATALTQRANGIKTEDKAKEEAKEPGATKEPEMKKAAGAAKKEGAEHQTEQTKKEKRWRAKIAETGLYIEESDFENDAVEDLPTWRDYPQWDDRPDEDLPQEPPVDPLYCKFCTKTPCVFLEWQEEIERIVEVMYPLEPNKTKRYHMYRRMSRELHGPLGRGCRKPLPHCFVHGFRDLYPDEKYTGFRDGPSSA